MKTLFVAGLALACAARAEPPATFAIDPSMPAAQAAIVRDVARAWCESTRAFCPVEAAWDEAEGRIYWSPDYAVFERKVNSCGYTEAIQALVRLNAGEPKCVEDLHMFWLVVAHEWGHLSGLRGHGHGLKLMAEELDPTLPLAIL